LQTSQNVLVKRRKLKLILKKNKAATCREIKNWLHLKAKENPSSRERMLEVECLNPGAFVFGDKTRASGAKIR
jgi:hypothetical protein